MPVGNLVELQNPTLTPSYCGVSGWYAWVQPPPPPHTHYLDIFLNIYVYVPYRYTQYTVTLAHNVICSWYVNCPLLLRKQFVSLITKVCLDNLAILFFNSDRWREDLDLQTLQSAWSNGIQIRVKYDTKLISIRYANTLHIFIELQAYRNIP